MKSPVHYSKTLLSSAQYIFSLIVSVIKYFNVHIPTLVEGIFCFRNSTDTAQPTWLWFFHVHPHNTIIIYIGACHAKL